MKALGQMPSLETVLHRHHRCGHRRDERGMIGCASPGVGGMLIVGDLGVRRKRVC